MSKLIAAMVATGGAATVAVGGSYILGKGDGNSTSNVKPHQNDEGDASGKGAGTSSPDKSGSQDSQQPQNPTDSKLKFKTLDEFKTKHGYKCSTSMFSGKDVNMSNLSGIGDLTSAGDFFGSPSSDTSKIKSCLIINWEKNTYTSSDNKWSGTFTWTWSFENENKGFVIVNIAKSENKTGELNWVGGAYFLEKKSNEETWEVKYKKEVETGKKFDNSNFDEKFPKVKSDSGVSAGTGNYWGFADGKESLTKICDSTSCSGDDVSKSNELEMFEWTWQQGGSKKIAEWSENLSWWDEIFVKSDFDLGSKLESFTGSWNKVTSTPQPSQ